MFTPTGRVCRICEDCFKGGRGMTKEKLQLRELEKQSKMTNVLNEIKRLKFDLKYNIEQLNNMGGEDMGKEILKTDIKREVGKLYYCGTSKDGCLVVCESVMARGRKAKPIAKAKKKK
jgi:hypothetical protein